jgi:hypothetical protein
MKLPSFLSRFFRDAPQDHSAEYAAVTVASTAGCCEVARATQEKPLLIRALPRLPLPGCSKPDECRCEFRTWADRRIGERRFTGGPSGDTTIVMQARLREGRDRRES